jgi:paraquat-inducible protein B
MAKKANPKLIGGFVVGAVALAVVGAIAFGGGKFLSPKAKAVMYFRESSLGGLDIGSPVTFRGVKIGSVTGLTVQYDVDKQTLQIPVHIEIELDKVEVVSGHRDIKNIETLVERGLRGQLVVQSFVTGQASIDFNFRPETPITLVGAEPGTLELPTIPSDIDLLKANVTSVLQKIAALPLEQIASETLATVKSANELVGNLNTQVQPLSDNLKGALDEATLTLKEAHARLELRNGEPMQNLNETLADARRLIDDLNNNIGPLAKDTLATLEQARHTLLAAQATVSPDSTLYFQLNRTLREIQAMASSIRAFADYMQRHPDALLTGKH